VIEEFAAQGIAQGAAAELAQAKEQYHSFEAQVHTAWSDLLRAEMRLRYMMGVPATDGRLISPVTDLTVAKIAFDWGDIHSEALVRNVELRQQRWRIKQRELELMAAKNQLLPRLDLVARHRFLGLGDELINSDGRAYTASNIDSLADTDAFSTIVDGNFQESQIGLQFNMNLGFRRELAAVRFQQLAAAQERKVLQEQEYELSIQLTEAVRVLDTAYNLMEENLSRVTAAEQSVKAYQTLFEFGTGTNTVQDLLLAQRLLADAKPNLCRALADYNVNIAQMHFRKGSLLEYNGVYLAEGPWPGKAYFDAHRLARARDAAHFLDYGFTRPDVISRGPVNQELGGAMIPGDAIPEDAIWSDGVPLPSEGQPTPAMPQDESDDAMPEELPAPGPATMKPMQNSIRLSQVRDSAVRQASHETPAPKNDRGPHEFEWNLDRPAGGNRGRITAESALPDCTTCETLPTKDSGRQVARNAVRKESAQSTSTIRLTAGSQPDPGVQESYHGEIRAPEAKSTSGWKRAAK
jgi:hypothetical protein